MSDSLTSSEIRAIFNQAEREKIRDLKKIIKEQDKTISSLKKAIGMRSRLDTVPKPKTVRVAYSKKRRPKAFQLHLSDTHSHEIVTRKQTDGRNEHNAEIGRERFRRIIEGAVVAMKSESTNCDPVHLTVWGGGDWMVNADLHYKMERCVYDEPLVEMENCYRMLQEELGILWKKVPTDSNSFVGSFSNHGRDSDKMEPGIESARSYDTAMYRRLDMDFPEIQFVIGETNWTIEDVGGFKTMYTHGHVPGTNVRRSAEGIMLPNWSFVSAMSRDHGLNCWVQGHHHTRCALIGSRFSHIQNGSIVGENSFSNSYGYRPEPPGQNLVVIDMESKSVEKVIFLGAESKKRK